jgi:hypothetical protein
LIVPSLSRKTAVFFFACIIFLPFIVISTGRLCRNGG